MLCHEVICVAMPFKSRELALHEMLAVDMSTNASHASCDMPRRNFIRGDCRHRHMFAALGHDPFHVGYVDIVASCTYMRSCFLYTSDAPYE